MLYLCPPSTGDTRTAMQAGLLGCITTPKQGKAVPEGALFCADNGRGPGKDGSIGKGYPGDEKYLGHLQDLWAVGGGEFTDPDTSSALFACAPDVLCGAAATLTSSRYMLPWIREIGFPAALVAQDGLEELDVPWDDFDVLFLGGSTEWKLGRACRWLAREAQWRGKRVHMGRVNSLKRLRYAKRIGCDSADGTKLTWGPDIWLPVILGWSVTLKREEAQAGLWVV